MKYWNARAGRVAKTLDDITQGSATAYVEQLVIDFETTQSKDTINNAIIPVSKLQRSILTCEAEVLELAGVGEEFRTVQAIAQRVAELILWLEDVLCFAMVEKDLIRKKHVEKALRYQLAH